jgi:hypothetical protein
MFWLSIALAIGIGAFAIFGAKVGIGTPLIALIFAGNAYARLHRPAVTRTPACTWAAWLALALSLAALAIAIYRVAYAA